MAKQEVSERRPKRRSRVGLVLLILFLLLLGAAGFLFYSVCKAPAALDDPHMMAASAPMPAADRFRFSSTDRTVQIKVGAADIWNFVLTHAGEDFLDMVNQEVSAYSLSVSGCGIQIDEKGLQLNLELYYGDLRLVAKVPCTLEAAGQHFSFKPAGVKLGVVPLPVSEYLSSVNLEFDFPLPVISSVTGIGYEQDAILITGSMREDIGSLVLPEGKMYRIAVFSESVQPLLDAVQTDAGYGSLLAQLEQDPGSIETLYREMFALAGPENTAEYLDSRMGLTQMVLPGIDYASLAATRTEMPEQVESLNAILERFFASVVSDYNGKWFTLSDGEFLKKLKPFHATNYGSGSYDSLFEALDPDSFFLVLVDAEDGFTGNTPPFDRLADGNQQFTQPVDFSKTYILGCVFRSVDGDPLLMYEAEVSGEDSGRHDLTIRALSEADVSALRVPGKIGVWTD